MKENPSTLARINLKTARDHDILYGHTSKIPLCDYADKKLFILYSLEYCLLL